jgi:thiamine kinase-like enzyme
MTIEKVSSADQAKDVAETFASFTLFFSKGFDLSLLKETIPHFHDLSLRSGQFENAIEYATEERKEHSKYLITALKKRKHYLVRFEMIKASRLQFPLRVMHHDAKIANIIFRADTGKVWCPVDLDTVMPGYYFSDLGDMIRSLAGSIDENDTLFSSMHIRENLYATLLESYSSVMEKEWTREEKANRHLAGPLLVYMQALRFATDHLNGDIYYQISYPGQNFDRAMNQLTLLERLEEFLLAKYGFTCDE